jgi:hypothetical protein
MFYCDFCAKENGWPRSSSRWKSVCEICDVLTECSDVPSVALPDPSPFAALHEGGKK